MDLVCNASSTPLMLAQFLKIKYGAPLHSVQELDGENGLKQYSIPFSFVIPTEFEYPHDRRPPLCCTLPPSFDYARSGPTRWHGSPRPALSVSYSLVARIQYQEGDDATRRGVEAKQAVTLLPFSDADPPTCIDDFPGEFVLRKTIALRKHALGGRLGDLVVTAGEPPPLIYSSPGAGASTECVISATVRPGSLSPGRLPRLAFDIKAVIRAKTFYSAKPIRCMPRQADLTSKALIRLHDAVLKLEEQRFSALEWEYAPADNLEGASLVRPSSSAHGSVWRARLTLAIKPPETLPPSFCGTLIARSYSLLVVISVSGARGKKCCLELPFQVVYHGDTERGPGTIPAQPAGGCKGPGALLVQEAVSPPRRAHLLHQII